MNTKQNRSTYDLNPAVISFKPTLILRCGRILKVSLQSGHSGLGLVSQKCLMHSRQKLCPHGMDVGFLKISRQILHWNCSSDNMAAIFLPENR